MAEDMRLLDQRQKTLLLMTQKAVWTSCSHRFPLALEYLTVNVAMGPGKCYVHRSLCPNWECLSLGTPPPTIL